MKGRITCPNCNHEYLLDTLNEDIKTKNICPRCKCNFTIKKTSDGLKVEGECSWEEHGEPRKTILSALKPKTNKPMMAGILLTCVFILGITSTIYSETFITSTVDILSNIGIKGNVEDTLVFSIIILIFSIIALIGAIASFKRQHFDIAIIGSILGIFSFGFLAIGSFLCIISLIILIYSKEEFKDGKKAKIF